MSRTVRRTAAATALVTGAIAGMLGAHGPAGEQPTRKASGNHTGPAALAVTPSATPSVTPPPGPTAGAGPAGQPSTTPTTTPRPAKDLRVGDSGPQVLAAQQRLSTLGYWLGTPDGHFGALTQQAVWALQKAAQIGRDGIVGPKTRAALEAGVRPTATLTGDGVEIDLERQLLLVVRSGAVSTILNTSTGSGERYISTYGRPATAITPKGTYRVLTAVDGMVHGGLGDLYRPLTFIGYGIAVHGSASIPPFPASHGCARVSNAAIDMIWAEHLMPVGSTVVVS